MATVGQNIGQTLEEQNLEFYCDFIDRKRNEKLNEELKPLPGLDAQNFEEILKEQLAKTDPATLNYKVFEIIKSLYDLSFVKLFTRGSCPKS